MALFFLLAGLEIKRQLLLGELRSLRAAALPVVAALGGMIVPALLYLAINHGHPGAHGWGIPVATDIAFAVGVVTLAGSRIPLGARIFILTLAVVDDVGGIIVIAAFYAENVELAWLAGAVGDRGGDAAAAPGRRPVLGPLPGARHAVLAQPPRSRDRARHRRRGLRPPDAGDPLLRPGPVRRRGPIHGRADRAALRGPPRERADHARRARSQRDHARGPGPAQRARPRHPSSASRTGSASGSAS